MSVTTFLNTKQHGTSDVEYLDPIPEGVDPSEDILTLLDSVPYLKWQDIQNTYVPPKRLQGYRCDPETGPRPPFAMPSGREGESSVQLALKLYEENKQVFDETYVGAHPSPDKVGFVTEAESPPEEGGENDHHLYYVSYPQFRNELLCSISLFLEHLAATSKEMYQVQLWMLCFEESKAFCFNKSNMWVSLLALPMLAPYLDRVRIINVGQVSKSMIRDLADPEHNAEIAQHVVILDDGIYSGTQFMRMVPAMVKACQGLGHIKFHQIAPYVTRFFLLRTGMPSSYLAMSDGEKIYDQYYNAMFADDMLDDVINVKDEEEDQLRGMKRLSKHVQHHLVPQFARSLYDEFWRISHLKVYATVLMDSNNVPQHLTNFYFAHKMPDTLSSTVHFYKRSTWEGLNSPYKRHPWTFGNVPLTQQFWEQHKGEADYMVVLQGIDAKIAEIPVPKIYRFGS